MAKEISVNEKIDKLSAIAKELDELRLIGVQHPKLDDYMKKICEDIIFSLRGRTHESYSKRNIQSDTETE